MINLYFLIPPVIAEIFNPTAELVVHIGIPIKEAKREIKVHPVSGEAKIRKCLFRVGQTFLCFSPINSFCFISSRK